MIEISSQENSTSVTCVFQFHGLPKTMSSNLRKMIFPKGSILVMLKHPPVIQKKRDVITKISLKQDLVKVNLPLVSIQERTFRWFLTAGCKY